MNITLILLIVLFLIPLAYAQESLPIGLQKIIDSNNQEAERASNNITFFIAFIAGALTFLSPCILPLLPAYFAVGFKEKKNVTLMTFVFFAGFCLVFMGFGIAAGLIGETSLTVFQAPTLATIAGILLIAMGVLSVLNKGIGSVFHLRTKQDYPGVFLQGVSFAFGWSACVGPILVGILSIAALIGDMLSAVILMMFYALGIFLPLVVLSMFYDKFKKSAQQPKTITIGKITTPLSNLIAGALLIAMGLVFVIFKNTSFVNGYDFFGTKEYFYSFQRYLFSNPWTTWIGIAAFGAFVAALIWFFRRPRQ